MIFSSLTFLFYFLPIFIIIYISSPDNYRNIILLLISFAFYFWGDPRPSLLLLLLLIISANYLCGLLIGWSTGKVQKLFLALGILGNISILFLFKYINFTIQTIENLLNTSIFIPYISNRRIVFPLGISFIIFKVISYIIDVYQGRVKPEKNVLTLATYISMFPLLIAGPIVRYETVINDLRERTLSRKGLVEGIKLFTIGLSFKVILANQFSFYADAVFSQRPEHLSICLAWLGAICYTLQIYFDFAGYSIMAIGLGKMIGFNFPDNFRLPYTVQSVTEFWRRWHITLTSWFRDYLYIPLGGNRRGSMTTYRNLIIVFFLCGMWHGPRFTFVFWGLYHGLFLIIERVFKENNIDISFPRFLKHLYLLIVITVGWVFFRSDNLHYAVKYIALMFGMIKGDTSYTIHSLTSCIPALITLMLIGIMCSVVSERNIFEYEMKIKSKSGIILKFACYTVLFLISVIILVISTHNPFIYQQF